jgi:hypothetical protein
MRPAQGVNQITWLWRRDKYRKHFLQILSNTQFRKCPKTRATVVSFLNKLCDQGGLKDEELYRRVHKLLHHNILQGLPGFEVACEEFTIKLHALKKSSYQSDHRSDKLVEILQRTLGQSEVDSIKTVLDIGCADGRITSAIGANLQIEPGNIHGCDVYENNENSDTSSNEQSNDDSFSDSTHSTDFTHSTNTP